MVDTVSVVIAVLGGFIVLYGFCSSILRERLYISDAFVAIVCGIIFGPICAKFIDVATWGDEVTISHQYSRLVIAIQVMATGIALPKAYLRSELASIAMMLGPIMLFMWLVSGLLVWALIPGLNFLEALMLAGCFTPTDPVLASSIVQGGFAEKHVPLHVRNLILCESGANDGLGYPFLFLVIYLLQMGVGPAIGKWAYWIMAFNILLSVVIGLIAGYVARRVLKYLNHRGFVDEDSLLGFSLAFALFLTGVVGLIGSDDLLACFFAGNAFNWDGWFRAETQRAHLMEILDVFLNLSIFAYIGITMPWSSFADPDIQLTVWRLVVLAALVLLLRRLPVTLLLYKFIPSLQNWREAIFLGWFGPIGVGAIFYCTVALEAVPEDGPNAHARSLIKPVSYFLVLASVVVYGMTIPVFYIIKFAGKVLRTKADNQTLADSDRNRQPSPAEGSVVLELKPIT